MDVKCIDVNSKYVNDYITSNKRKLLKIHNTIVLLESKYLSAKKSIKSAIDAVKNELIGELDVIYENKLQSLLDFQRKIEDYVLNLLNVCDNSHHLHDIVRAIENCPSEVRLLHYISLDFIREDVSVAKSAIGYLKTCTVLPEELTLTLSKLDDKYWLEVKSSKPWHSLLIYSLTAFAENFRGRKLYGNIIDRKDGFYSIAFPQKFSIDFKVSVMVYGRHIRNSPLTIKVPPLRCAQFGSCLENGCVDMPMPKTFKTPNQNEMIPKLLDGDCICNSLYSENAEKQSFKVTGIERDLAVKEEALKQFLATRVKDCSPGEWTEKENIYSIEESNISSLGNCEDWFSPVGKVNSSTTKMGKLNVNDCDNEKVECPKWIETETIITRDKFEVNTNDSDSVILSKYFDTECAEKVKQELNASRDDKDWSPRLTEIVKTDEFIIQKAKETVNSITGSKINSDIKAESLINTPTTNLLSSSDENKSNGTVSTLKENAMVDSSYVDKFLTKRKERRNSSSVTKEALMNANNISSFLSSNQDKSMRSANKMDNLKISSTGGDGFWYPQAVENLNRSMRSDSTRACKSLNYTYDDDEEKIVPITAKLTHMISKQSGVDLNYPIGVAVSDNKDIVICDTGNHRVWIIDKTGKRKALFNTTSQGKRLCRPSAVVMFQNGDLAIKDDNSLNFYDSNGIFIESIGSKILNRPFGLVLTEDEKLVTLSECRQPKLCVFNKDGRLEHKSLFQPLLNRPENSKCRFMATYNNELVVSDLGLSKMYKTTLLGEQIQVFGSYGKTPGYFNEPSGIALDPSGTMLIGDSKNDRIQIFDWDGEYLGGVLFLKCIRRPSDITLTSDGYLYVLNYLDHFLGIYKLEADE